MIKKIITILLFSMMSTIQTRSQSSLLLPSFEEALHTYYANASILRNNIAHIRMPIEKIEQDLCTKQLAVTVGSLLLRDADYLLRDQPLNEYRKKMILTIIALLKAQKNHHLFEYHHPHYTVTLKKLIDNVIRKLNHQELVPPDIW